MASYDLESKNGMLLLADDGVSLRPGGCCCGPACCSVVIRIWQFPSGYDHSVVWSGSHSGFMNVGSCQSIACTANTWQPYATCSDSRTCGNFCGQDVTARKYESTGGGTTWEVALKYRKGSGRKSLVSFQYADTREPSASTFDVTVTSRLSVAYGAEEQTAADRPVITATSTRGGVFNGTLNSPIVARGADISTDIAVQRTNYGVWGGEFTTTITIE